MATGRQDPTGQARAAASRYAGPRGEPLPSWVRRIRFTSRCAPGVTLGLSLQGELVQIEELGARGPGEARRGRR